MYCSRKVWINLLQSFLRTIGIACILTGTVLYFTNSTSSVTQSNVDNSELREEITALQEKFDRTKEELAKLQMTTSTSTNPINDESKKEESPKPSVIKTILRVEPGTTSSTISQELVRTGIIDDVTEFESYLTTNDLSVKIQIGEYELDSSMSINQIASKITSSN